MTTNREPTLGVHLLETITRGMYSEPFHSIREYIQNAYDSIRKARRQGLIPSEEGEIVITIDETAKSLSIRDNGTGLSPEEAAVHLLDIGHSEKARSGTGSDANAGFRGIGRMAGISYCKTLRFETSCGDGKKCVVEFDAAGINRLTQRGQQPATIVQAINQNSRIHEVPSDDESHYLEVTLEGMDRNSPFLNEDLLHNYLAMNAPVPYDPSVWSYADSIQFLAEAAGYPAALENVPIRICDNDGNIQVDVRRPFKDTFQFTNARNRKRQTIRVTNVEALPQAGEKNRGWWGWIAVHERQSTLNIPFAGLRIRMHNIAIGDETILRTLFTTPSLARWCFGEIHVTDLSITPNAQRDNFEPSKEWNQLKAALQEEIILLEKAFRNESTERNKSLSAVTKKSINLIEKAKDDIESGFLSHHAKQTTIKNLEAETEKLETQAKKAKWTEAEKTELVELHEKIQQVTEEVRAVRRTGTDDALSHLNKQARNAVRTVFEVLKDELDERQFNVVQKKVHAALKPGNKRSSAYVRKTNPAR